MTSVENRSMEAEASEYLVETRTQLGARLADLNHAPQGVIADLQSYIAAFQVVNFGQGEESKIFSSSPDDIEDLLRGQMKAMTGGDRVGFDVGHRFQTRLEEQTERPELNDHPTAAMAMAITLTLGDMVYDRMLPTLGQNGALGHLASRPEGDLA